MLCADVRESKPLAAARRPSGEKSIVAKAGGLASLCCYNGVLFVLEMSNEAVRRCQVARKHVNVGTCTSFYLSVSTSICAIPQPSFSPLVDIYQDRVTWRDGKGSF